MHTADCTMPASSQISGTKLESLLRLQAGLPQTDRWQKTGRRNPKMHSSEGLDEQGPSETAENTKEFLYSRLNNEEQPGKTWQDNETAVLLQ